MTTTVHASGDIYGVFENPLEPAWSLIARRSRLWFAKHELKPTCVEEIHVLVGIRIES